jgi:hypothetical protein
VAEILIRRVSASIDALTVDASAEGSPSKSRASATRFGTSPIVARAASVLRALIRGSVKVDSPVRRIVVAW